MISAQTCIINTGSTILGSLMNIYTASTAGVFGLTPAFTNVSLSSLIPPNCPFNLIVPDNTVQIKIKDDFLTKCELILTISGGNICQNCNLGLSLFSTNTINKIDVGNLTGSCGTITDYRIYWYGPDSTTTLAYTSGFGTAFTPYTYTHPLTGSSAITGVTLGTYVPVIDKVKINNVNYSQTGFSASATSCLTNCLTPVVVRDPLSFQGIWAVTGGTEMELPYIPLGTYSGTINWGDGFTSANTYANRAHTYAATSSYTITITGTITGWRWGLGNNNANLLQLREIIKFGPLRGASNNNQELFFQTSPQQIGCENLVLTGLTDTPDLVGIISLQRMFRDCSSLTTVPGINTWDTSSVTSMSEMFRGVHRFNQPIGNWNVSNVTNMSAMFRQPGNQFIMQFNQDLGNWDVSNVSDMSFMFEGCTGFTNGGSPSIGNWITSAVTDMNNMFFGASVFDQNLGNWNVSKVEDMSRMFRGAGNFNNGGSPSISGWTTSATTNMLEMFFGASNFNQPIGSWNVSGVTNMGGMFFSTTFNQPLSGWNVSNVLSGSSNNGMERMFQNNNAFVQDISNWCVYPNQYSSINAEPNNFSVNTSPSWLSSQKPVWSSTTSC